MDTCWRAGGRRGVARTRPACCACLPVLGLFLLLNLLSVYLLHTAPSPWLHSHGGVVPRAGRRAWGIATLAGAGAGSGRPCQPGLRRLDPPARGLSALASAPGSGNTWLRYVVQQATGLITGSEYNDSALRTAGFPGEGVRDGTALLVKTHDAHPATLQRYGRGVLLLRHPRDAILAEFHRRHRGHLGHATPEDFEQHWKAFVPEALDQWTQFNTQWLRFSGPLHVVRYEDLLGNLSYTIRGVLHFLNASVSESDLACAVQYPGVQFRRTKMQSRPEDLFSREMESMAQESAVKVQTALEALTNKTNAEKNKKIRSMMDVGVV